MGYHRIQKDLERRMKQKRRDITASSLSDPMFKKRVVESEKEKHKRRKLTKQDIENRVYHEYEK
tara:strand:+ start:1597 stop:1788 length:192 start_codon:yes stop_codon:yes gene_type:complete